MRYFLLCLCVLLVASPIHAAPKFSDADVAELARLEREMNKGYAEHDRILTDRNANEKRVLESNLSPEAKNKAIERINKNYATKSRRIVEKRREPYIKQLKKMVPGLQESDGSKFRNPDGSINTKHRGWTGDFDFEGSTLSVYRKADAQNAARVRNIEHIKQENTSSKADKTLSEIEVENRRINGAVDDYTRRHEVTGITAREPARKTSDVSYGAAETTANFDSTVKTLEDQKKATIAQLDREIAQGSYQDRHGNTVTFEPDSQQAITLEENREIAKKQLTDIQNNPGKYDSFEKVGDSSHQLSEQLRNNSLETSAEFGMRTNQNGTENIKAHSLFQKGASGLALSGEQLVNPRNVAEMQGMVKATSKTLNVEKTVLPQERIKELAIKNGLVTEGPNSEQQLDQLKKELADKKLNPHFENMSPAQAEKLKGFSKDVLLETIDASKKHLKRGEKQALVRVEAEALDVEKKRKIVADLEDLYLNGKELPRNAKGEEVFPDEIIKAREDLNVAKQQLKNSQNDFVDTKVRNEAAENANKEALERLDGASPDADTPLSASNVIDGPDTPGGAKQTLEKASEAGQKIKEVYKKQIAKGAGKGFVRGGGVAALFGIYQTVNAKGKEVYDRSPDATNTELVAETMWETGKELSNYNKLKGVFRKSADQAHEDYKNVEKGSLNEQTGGLASFFGNLTWSLGALAFDEVKGMTWDVGVSAKDAIYEGVLLGDALLKEVQATAEGSAALQQSVDAQLAVFEAQEAEKAQNTLAQATTPSGTVDAWGSDDNNVSEPLSGQSKSVSVTGQDDVWGEVPDHKELPSQSALNPLPTEKVYDEEDLWAEGDRAEEGMLAQNRYRLEQQLAQDKAQDAANNDRQNKRQFAQAQERRAEEERIKEQKRREWAEFSNAFTGALGQIAGQIQQAKNDTSTSSRSVQVGDYSAVNAYDRKVQDCVSSAGRPGFAVTDIHAAKMGCSQKLGPRPQPTFKTQAGSGSSNYGNSAGASSGSSWGNSTPNYSNNTDGNVPNYNGLNVADNRSANDYGSTSDAWGTTAPKKAYQNDPMSTQKGLVNVCGVMAVKLGDNDEIPSSQWTYTKSNISLNITRNANGRTVEYERIEFGYDCAKRYERLQVDNESYVERRWNGVANYLASERRTWYPSNRFEAKIYQPNGSLSQHFKTDVNGRRTNLMQ